MDFHKFVLIKPAGSTFELNTNFCIQFRITLKSMRSQCHGQNKSLTVQHNSRRVMRIASYTKVCTAAKFDHYTLADIFS